MQFTTCAERWLAEANHSEITQRMRRSFYLRNVHPIFEGRQLNEITDSDVRQLCVDIKSRGAPAVAVQVLSLIRATFRFATSQGYDGANPARFISNASVMKPCPRKRVLSSEEIGLLFGLLDEPSVKDYHRLAFRLLLLTLARRSELLLACWSEIDFDECVWIIPPGRAKSRRSRCVQLSDQAIDIFIQLKTLAGKSEFVFPSSLDPFRPMAPACLDVCTHALSRRAAALGLPMRSIAPSDFRTTAEEHLKQAGFDWELVEVAMAREVVMQRLHIVESDLHVVPLRHMMQAWADKIDRWTKVQDGT